MAQLQIGMSHEREYAVTYAMTAAALAESNPHDRLILPAVWSTPDMIARMEMVSAALVAPHLEAGQITVGARNDVSHLAATPTGMTVRVRATLSDVDGRKLTLTVEAFDEKEKVGDGVHVRFVVERAKFDARLALKTPQA